LATDPVGDGGRRLGLCRRLLIGSEVGFFLRSSFAACVSASILDVSLTGM